jgi:hypothetical protein
VGEAHHHINCPPLLVDMARCRRSTHSTRPPGTGNDSFARIQFQPTLLTSYVFMFGVGPLAVVPRLERQRNHRGIGRHEGEARPRRESERCHGSRQGLLASWVGRRIRSPEVEGRLAPSCTRAIGRSKYSSIVVGLTFRDRSGVVYVGAEAAGSICPIWRKHDTWYKRC